MKVAIVHDWLTGMRGGEKVLEVLCERYPEAELFTLLYVPGSVSPTISRHRIHTSPLQRLPGIRRYYRQCLPIFPALVEQIDLEPFDVVISSSHCVAKSVLVKPGAVHVCYCHTPMRYAWDQFEAYFGRERMGPFRRLVLRQVMAYLARWDQSTASRVTRFVTNSRHVAQRIARYYNREASVVYPPVDTTFFRPATSPHVATGDCLIVSALVPYKRIDIAIDACRIAGVPLTIVGNGPERPRLERFAAETGGRVTFLGRVSDEEVRDQYHRAALVLMPGEEDFGIAPLEAQACGRPVVALARGGALESIVRDETGLLVDEPTPQAFADAIQRGLAHRFDQQVVRRHAERFSRARFGDQMQAIVDETVGLRESPAC
jgi:glycosyltransferase involved in cell wall biosynthesis